MSYCSKRAQLFSRLEGYLCHIAPNVGNFSRVWRGMQVFPLRIPTSVYTFSSCGLVAQWIERLPPEQKVVGSNPIKPTFDFLLSILSLTSTFRLSRVGGINYSRLSRFGRACLFPALSVVFCRIVAYALVHLRRCVYM